jgi:hypothetical protein
MRVDWSDLVRSPSNTPPSSPLILIDRRVISPVRADQLDRRPTTPVRAPGSPIWIDAANRVPTTPLRAPGSPIQVDRVPATPIQPPSTPIQVNRLPVSPPKVQESPESSLEVWFTPRPSPVRQRLPSPIRTDNGMPETQKRMPEPVRTNKDVSVAIQVGNKVFSLEARNKWFSMELKWG